MSCRVICGLSLILLASFAGCGNESNELAIPMIFVENSGTSAVSPQFAALNGGVPAGLQVTFVGDVFHIQGGHFRSDMKAFLGMNNDLARRPDSLMTTERHLLPGEPFVYTDPVSGRETILEVEVDIEFSDIDEIRIRIPAEVACSANFTNPIVRLYGDDGSSFPKADLLFIVGPRGIALTPNRGPDTGEFSVTVHGDFFSRYTQIGFRYRDPMDGEVKVLGDTPETDIVELYVDRHTLVIPDWPGVVPNSTLGLARELPVTVLFFENIDAITGNSELEPGLGGVPPCNSLEPESPDAPLQRNGVRNSEKPDAFIFQPTGVTDYPVIEGITPESGPEIGGNTVIVHGQQFDAFSVAVNNSDPGFGIECPPDSGKYISPKKATLVDRQTIALVMPECPVDIPEKVNFAVRNKYSMDNPPQNPEAGDRVVFHDIYTYLPIPPIEGPVIYSIFPAGEGTQPQGAGHDYGLERFMVVGDWFDHETAVNGGFEFLLPDGVIVQTQRSFLHNRNLLEIYTKRLPDEFYPLSEDLHAGIRVRNSSEKVSHVDYEDAFVFMATPKPEGDPFLTEIFPDTGSMLGGTRVMVFGGNFHTTTEIYFGSNKATDVQYIHQGLLFVTAPAGSLGPVEVTADLQGEPLTYTYTNTPDDQRCAALAFLDPDHGSSTGGYDILAYGIDLSPLTRIEFGVDSGNFSDTVTYIDDHLLRVRVPEALPEQIGATIPVGATDPLHGCDEVLRTVDFTYTAAQQSAPEIYFVDTTVEVPATPTNLPALRVGGTDRMLVIGKYFDQATTFDITKPTDEDLESEEEQFVEDCTEVTVLTPNIAVMTAPASPDDEPGIADLMAHNAFGSSAGFAVEYVEPGPPAIIDVRNLDSGRTEAPIDANDRILIFGDNFFSPLSVRLIGCNPELGSEGPLTYTVPADKISLIEDHLIGINIPPNMFCEGLLGIEVETEYGIARFEEDGKPIFMLLGPQPPIVDGVFETTFSSHAAEEAVFFGRYFTPSTQFSVRTSEMEPDTFEPVYSTLIVSETVAVVTMPALPGAPAPGAPGRVRADETDSTLAAKINGLPYTISEELFRVVDDAGPALLAVFPDHGSIDGGEQVLLIGANFLKDNGEANITDIKFVEDGEFEVGDYEEASSSINSLNPEHKGLYLILNDHEILLITNPHDPILPEQVSAPVDVILVAGEETSEISGGYTYLNTPAVLTPYLLGITPNETRLNGGTSHLLSGGFLTHADRIIFEDPDDEQILTLDVDDFAEVNDSFLVFVMPDLTGIFDEGDLLDVTAEKDVTVDSTTTTLRSNTLNDAIRVTFAGPPIITASLDPDSGSAFGGQQVNIYGNLFTSNSQVLFGTMPARHVVFVPPNGDDPAHLIAIAPALPVNVPDPGIDLLNIHEADGTVDVAVYTQGGWAVVKDAFTFEPAVPEVDSCSPEQVPEGATVRVTVYGANFVPDNTWAESSYEGTEPDILTGGQIDNLVVHSFTELSFDYTAPTWEAETSGPMTDEIEIWTNHGTAEDTCDIEVQLTPFFTECTTTYSQNNNAAPTTGVENSAFVKVTVLGGNFHTGGAMTLTPRSDDQIALTEIGAQDSFYAGGQFQLLDDGTIVFTVPYFFAENAPNIIDGNPNVGPVDIAFENANGLGTAEEDCFYYVPAFVDFEDFSYPVPVVDPKDTSPGKLEVDDVNKDGLNDVVSLVWQDCRLDEPDGMVYFADTFGEDVDVNGDGVTPDFAGTFSKFVISNDDIRTNIYSYGRGAQPRLLNMDDDDQLEIVLPGYHPFMTNKARLLLVDVKPDGSLGNETIITATSLTHSEAVAGIAVGNFDSKHAGSDIAIIIGSPSQSQRQIVIFASTSTAFSFTNSATDIDDPFDDWKAAGLAAGDFDDDGDDDLIWGQASESWEAPIMVAEIDASTGTVDWHDCVTNLYGGEVHSITIFDADGDGDDDAFVAIDDSYSGGFVTGVHSSKHAHFPGVGVFLDPLGLKADDYLQTGFAKDGRHIASGDLNGDEVFDIAVGGKGGEFVVYFGNGEGGFENSGRSWTLPTAPSNYWYGDRSHDIEVGDINNDGLAEVFMSDVGANPMAVILWLNASR